LYWEVDEQC